MGKDDKAIKFAEQVLGCRLYPFQKDLLRRIQEGKHPVIHPRPRAVTHSIIADALKEGSKKFEKQMVDQFTSSSGSEVFSKEKLEELVVKFQEEERKTEEALNEAIKEHFKDKIPKDTVVKRHKMLPENTIYIVDGAKFPANCGNMLVHNIVLR